MPFGDISLSAGASRFDPPQEPYGLGQMVLDSLTVPFLPDSVLEGLHRGPRPSLPVAGANFGLFMILAYALGSYDLASTGTAGGALLFGLAPVFLAVAAALAAGVGVSVYPAFLIAGGRGPANRVILLLSLCAPLALLQIMLNSVSYLWALPGLALGWIWIRGAVILFEAPLGGAFAVFGMITVLITGGQWFVRFQIDRARGAYREFRSRNSPSVSAAKSVEAFLDGIIRVKPLSAAGSTADAPAADADEEQSKVQALKNLQEQLAKLARDPQTRLPGAAPKETAPPEVQRELAKFRDRITEMINDPVTRLPGKPPVFMAPPGVDRIFKGVMKKVEDAINAPQDQQEKKVEEAIKSLIDLRGVSPESHPPVQSEPAP